MAQSNKKRFPLVIVEWEDIVSDSSWMDIREAKHQKPYNCESIGYLIEKNKKNIVLVPNVSYAGLGFGYVSIPIGCIKKINIIKGYLLNFLPKKIKGKEKK